MKIRSIFAKNVFNFGPQGVEWKDIPDRSILVGPNGSGKTNIFRLLTLVADSFVYATRLQHPEIEQRLFEIFQTADSKARIEFELADDEITAICDWLTLNAFGQIQNFRQDRQSEIRQAPNLDAALGIANESERVVKRILKESADSFRKLIGNIMALVIEGSGTPRNPARQYAIVRSDVPHLYSTTSWPLTTDPYANGGTPVYLPDFVWKKFKEFSPQASKRGSSESALNDNDIATFLQKYGIDWLQAFSSQSAQVLPGVPMTLWNQVQMSDEDFIPFIQRLHGFLTSRNYIADSIGLLDLFGLIFRGSIVRVSEIRARPSGSEVAFIPPPFEKTLTIDGSGLAPFLFQIKNGFSKVERDLFQNLRKSFREVTGSDLNFEFDVVAYDESAQGENASSNLKCEVRFTDLNSNTELSAEYVPGSVIETLTILASVALSEAKRCVLLLDEPALNLHPTMQRKLSNELLTLPNVQESRSMGYQLFIVTHSPYFLPADTMGLRSIVRIARSGSVAELHIPKSGLDLDEVGEDLRRYPQLRSALFARKVILMEGYDEEAALPVWFEKCDGKAQFDTRNIMFVNVMGQGSFVKFSKILGMWGIPCIGIGDAKNDREVRAEGTGNFRLYTYPRCDLSELYQSDGYKEVYERVCVDIGVTPCKENKNPLVARIFAERTDPPEIIRRLWESIKSFVLEP